MENIKNKNLLEAIANIKLENLPISSELIQEVNAIIDKDKKLTSENIDYLINKYVNNSKK